MVVVGAIGLGVWFCREFVERFLSTPHTVAGVTISTYGHQADGLLTHSFDSIKVEMEGTTIRVAKPVLDVTILRNPRGVTLDMDTVDAYIELADSTRKKTPSKADASVPTFPQDFEIPFPAKVSVKQANLRLSNHMSWKASKLQAKNYGSTSVGVIIDQVQGDYVSSPASVVLSGDFASENLRATARIKTDKDSVSLKAEAPRQNLSQLKTNVDVTVSDPEKWIPVKLPEALPGIGKLLVSGNATLDVQKGSAKYDATVKTRIGALWPLEAEDVTVRVKGDQDNFNTDIFMSNGEGGTIHFNGEFDKNLDGIFEAQVQHMNAKFGPQMMPLDVEILSAEKKGSFIDAKLETRQGSRIDAHLDFTDSLMITFVGDIATYEPWALDWTHGNVIIKNPKLFGTFDMHKLRVLAKFDTIPYAYHMTADSAQVQLALDPEGIVFNNCVLYTPKEIFDFDGDVIWGTSTPHTSWDVTQRKGGKARAYIGLGDTLFLDAKATSTVIETIPFADIKLSEKIKGNVTGWWHQDFDNNVGKAEVSVEGVLDAFKVSGDIVARQSGDTIFVDDAIASQSKNAVKLNAAIVLPNDSNPDFKPTSFLPVQVLHAWVSSKEFSVPLLLEPLNDSTFTSGMISGELDYKEGEGLNGKLDFTDIAFAHISKNLLNIKNMSAFAARDKVELNSYLDIGNGGWAGNTQIILDNIFGDKHHLSFAHGSNNGGTLWAEGSFDNDLMFQGTVDASGSWYIPKTISEIQNTDLHIDVSANLKKGLKGIVADIRSDSTSYQPPKLNIKFPFRLRGHLEDGLLDISEAGTHNESGETINATIRFNLDSMKLEAVDVVSQQFSLDLGIGKLTLGGITGHLEDHEKDLAVTADIQKIAFTFEDNLYGKAEALAHGNVGFSIPHSEKGVIIYNTISGDILIDKFVYYNDFNIDVTPSSLEKYSQTFNNYVGGFLRKEAQEEKLSTASPINLSVHIHDDNQSDSIAIVTPVATFPLAIDLLALGNTTRPLLRGDITNTNTGFIGIKDIYQFDLNSFRISWSDETWQNGTVEVNSSQDLPYCSDIEEKEKETCPINLEITGKITSLQIEPKSNCGMESSAATYYSIFLGCIADDGGENTDWNEFAGKAIGKVISTAANKTLGGDYIGDIEMKMMLFDNTSMNDKDSSFFKVPISLDRWVKDLSLILGYTRDQSENPTYDQALQVGVNYKLPFIREEENTHKNHISPALTLNAQLISKQYLTNTGTDVNENRLEKNVGINYIYRFWNPCLLGLGKCEDAEESEKTQKQSKQKEKEK